MAIFVLFLTMMQTATPTTYCPPETNQANKQKL